MQVLKCTQVRPASWTLLSRWQGVGQPWGGGGGGGGNAFNHVSEECIEDGGNSETRHLGWVGGGGVNTAQGQVKAPFRNTPIGGQAGGENFLWKHSGLGMLCLWSILLSYFWLLFRCVCVSDFVYPFIYCHYGQSGILERQLIMTH